MEAIFSIFSSPVMAFILGAVAALVKSDFKMPEDVHRAISIYLLFAIGLKGGDRLKDFEIITIISPIFAVVAIGVLTSFVALLFAVKIFKFQFENAVALMAHYGSVSLVTFITTTYYLENNGQSYQEAYMPLLIVVLEVPAILFALFYYSRKCDGMVGGLLVSAKRVLFSKSILLLVGGIIIGRFLTDSDYQKVAKFFIDPFSGVLMLFMLEMGRVAFEQVSNIKRGDVGKIVLYGIFVPVINSAFGAVFGKMLGFSDGGVLILAVCAASSSYIAATASIRLSVPKANPSIYLVASLGVTFPFNIICGIAFYDFLYNHLF